MLAVEQGNPLQGCMAEQLLAAQRADADAHRRLDPTDAIARPHCNRRPLGPKSLHRPPEQVSLRCGSVPA
jgi:hypothetical protein